MYFYESPIGMFTIERHPDGFWLSLDGELLDVCDTAQAAADNVYVHSIGSYQWDRRAGKVPDVPENIREWTRG